MIFPLIFKMVDLESSIDSSTDTSFTTAGLNTAKIESKLYEHGFQDVNRRKIEVLI